MGVVLAGGASRRMGSPKALLQASEGTWLERAVARLEGAGASPVLVAGGEPAWVPPTASYVADGRPGQGPLAGIESAMERSRAQGTASGGAASGRWCLVLACDLPRLEGESLVRLLDARGPIDHSPTSDTSISVVAAVGPGGLEPLVALYHDSLLPDLRAFLDSGRRSARAFLDSLGTTVARVELPAAVLWNANTPQDLRDL
jgi:molybdenum cofactor guanylyltransferase